MNLQGARNQGTLILRTLWLPVSRYVASSCHTSFVQGVRRGGCYMDMMFFCMIADSAGVKCRALDASELIGTKIKLDKRQRAVLTDMAITKSTKEDEILQY